MSLIVCSHCGCHAHNTELDCPHCGGQLRRRDGARILSLAALLAGLSVVAGAGACIETEPSQDDDDGSASANATTGMMSTVASYGVSVTSAGGFGPTGGVGGAGGANGGAGGANGGAGGANGGAGGM